MIHLGDNMDVLRSIESNSVDSIVTDPPYGISFMNKHWDYDIPTVELWKECMRVLKPGGHMLVACGTRTQHRMVVNIEDAGFEIRDVVTWLYGSGFPKSTRINRDPMFCQCGAPAHSVENKDPLQEPVDHIYKAADALYDDPQPLDAQHSMNTVLNSQVDCRQRRDLCDEHARSSEVSDLKASPSQQYAQEHNRSDELDDVLANESLRSLSRVQCSDRPSNQDYSHHGNSLKEESKSTLLNSTPSDTSKSFSHKLGSDLDLSKRTSKHANGFPLCLTCNKPNANGFGTALKPACEFWTLCRKPLSESTVAKNVIKWGTGGINVDGCRVECEPRPNREPDRRFENVNTYGNDFCGSKSAGHTTQGRWPANLIFDEEAAEMLDEQSGPCKTGNIKAGSIEGFAGVNAYGVGLRPKPNDYVTDKATGASRFFYVAKASKRERNAGLDSSDLIWETEVWEKQVQNLLTENISQHLKAISEDILTADKPWSTDLYGHSISEQYPKGLMFTIETAIRLITELKTSNSFQNSHTKENIQDAIKTIEASGLSLAESAEFLNQLELISIREQTASLLGAVRAVLKTLLEIKGYAKSGNFHSTVKPIKLMEYLCKLITPPGGIVLDPFMGSGSTGIAAKNLGFRFIGIELTEEYFEIAKARIG